MNVHSETWTSLFAQPISDKTGVVDERIGELIQEILSQQPDHPEHKVIVLPLEGKAKCMELKESLNKQECDLYQDSELAVKTFLEWNKAFLKQKGQWTTYLKALECFARQKEGFLETYLESELSKEALKKLLAQDEPDRKQLYELIEKAFASSESLDMSDLWILDQISRLGLREYLNCELPISIERIQAAVHHLATTLKPIDIIDSSNPSLFKGLAIWLIDSTAEGNKKEAVNRIIEAWLLDSIYLDLSKLGLNKIPPEIGQLSNLRKLYLYNNNLQSLPPIIGQLANLQELSLFSNNLQSLPSEIGQLSNLKELYLGKNNLQSLPPEIGQLANLQELSLFSNNLQSLPSEIGQLANLKWFNVNENNLQSLPPEIGRLAKLQQLNLYRNKLQSLPPEIGQLAKLQQLYLYNNNLQSLPPTIGQLLSLQSLILFHNQNLNDLPMSLGNIPGLTFLDINGTQIPRQTVDVIHQQCGMMRDKEALEILPKRLEKWQTTAKSTVNLTGIQSLIDAQKINLNEWLVRLEKTRDFAHAQSSLAVIVCNMLDDVIKNKDFRELFFAQAEANNTACEDRAAMSLNEIYTSWKILNMPKDTSLRKKLELMARGAKTISLRNRIDELIAAEERKKFTERISALEEKGVKIDKEIREKIRQRCEERESVEIFLNYETALKEKLNLLSAIEKMRYRTIGERSWIDQKALEKHVNDNYFKELYELPVFQKELLADTKIQAKMGAIEELHGEKLSSPTKDANEQQILDYAAEITRQQNEEKIKVARAWYERGIS